MVVATAFLLGHPRATAVKHLGQDILGLWQEGDKPGAQCVLERCSGWFTWDNMFSPCWRSSQTRTGVWLLAHSGARFDHLDQLQGHRTSPGFCRRKCWLRHLTVRLGLPSRDRRLSQQLVLESIPREGSMSQLPGPRQAPQPTMRQSLSLLLLTCFCTSSFGSSWVATVIT